MESGYDDQIEQALYDAGHHAGLDGDDFLFGCAGGDGGIIYAIQVSSLTRIFLRETFANERVEMPVRLRERWSRRHGLLPR